MVWRLYGTGRSDRHAHNVKANNAHLESSSSTKVPLRLQSVLTFISPLHHARVGRSLTYAFTFPPSQRKKGMCANLDSIEIDHGRVQACTVGGLAWPLCIVQRTWNKFRAAHPSTAVQAVYAISVEPGQPDALLYCHMQQSSTAF